MTQQYDRHVQKEFCSQRDGRLAQRLITLRKSKGWSQVKLARILTENGCSVSDSSVSTWEKVWLPGIHYIVPVARAFGLTPRELVQGTEVESEYGLITRMEAARHPATTNLAEIYQRFVDSDGFHSCPGREGPTKTHLKKFARMFGHTELESCPVSVLYQSPSELRRIIDERAPSTTSIHELRNLKNNVGFFVREASTAGLLSRTEHLYSDKATHRLKDYPVIKGTNLFSKIKLTESELQGMPTFREQLKDFREYCSDPLRAPRRIHKRPVTIESHINVFLLLAGVFVRFLGASMNEISLQFLCDPQNLRKFSTWHIARTKERQQKLYVGLDPEKCTGVTQTLFTYLVKFSTTAKYYLKDPETCRVIREEIMGYLPHPQAMKIKDSRLISIPTLEATGLSVYPFNSRRMAESEHVRRTLEHLMFFWNDPEKVALEGPLGCEKNVRFRGAHLAVRVGVSVMIRLLVRLPLRMRNILEMEVGKNLSKQQDGNLAIRFSGRQLKVEQVRGRTKRVDYVIEPDNTGFYELMMEWLTLWRPFLIVTGRLRKEKNSSAQRAREVIQEIRDANRKSSSDELPCFGSVRNVFVNMKGQPMSKDSIYEHITRYSYRYTGKSVNPHLVRDIWATDYLRDTRSKYGSCDIVGAAWMLGNSIDSVERHYAHILDETTGIRPRQWLLERLSEPPEMKREAA